MIWYRGNANVKTSRKQIAFLTHNHSKRKVDLSLLQSGSENQQ
jgi:hypothetical protein